jgi:regulatory protein
LDAKRNNTRRSGQPRSTPRARPSPHEIKPGTITAVAPTKRDPERVSVSIDGAFAFALPAIVAVQRGLKRGVVLDEAAVLELAELAEAERAVEAALNFVSYRPRSEREVRDRLRQRGFPPDAIDYAVDKMRGWNYLNDRAFAEFWVENRTEHSPRGKRALQAELRAKGVDRAVVGDVLESTDLNESDAALELARKRLRSLSSLDEATQKRRLAAYLGRRGYGWDVIRPVFATLFSGEGAADDDESAFEDDGPMPP